jgi:hypothetical protein
MHHPASTMALSNLIPIPANINPDLKPARQTTMLSLLGSPGENLSDACREPTNRTLVQLLTLGDLGRFRVFGLKPAGAANTKASRCSCRSLDAESSPLTIVGFNAYRGLAARITPARSCRCSKSQLAYAHGSGQ